MNKSIIPSTYALVLLLCMIQAAPAQDILSASDLLGLKNAGEVQISPDGTEMIYSVSTPRGPNEAPGEARSRYFRMILADGTTIPLFPGDMKGSDPLYHLNGNHIGFLYAKNGEPSPLI